MGRRMQCLTLKIAPVREIQYLRTVVLKLYLAMYFLRPEASGGDNDGDTQVADAVTRIQDAPQAGAGIISIFDGSFLPQHGLLVRMQMLDMQALSRF